MKENYWSKILHVIDLKIGRDTSVAIVLSALAFLVVCIWHPSDNREDHKTDSNYQPTTYTPPLYVAEHENPQAWKRDGYSQKDAAYLAEQRSEALDKMVQLGDTRAQAEQKIRQAENAAQAYGLPKSYGQQAAEDEKIRQEIQRQDREQAAKSGFYYAPANQ